MNDPVFQSHEDRVREIAEYEATHPFVSPSDEAIVEAIRTLEAVETLFTNEMGKNHFYRWIKAKAEEWGEPAAWILEALSTEPQPAATYHERPLSFIFNLCSALEDELDEREYKGPRT